MYLKEIRINGFKSFADTTRLEFRPGVTAIVGPNGCGKSNTADAIRWVLGEQSAKSLRAGAMQDVIFQGTTNRKPHNLCEVALLFTDCEKQLGTAFNEVEVTRRVIRDGGSEYFLNGKPCRLKDIQRLFLDTGVGQVSYSFMLQGQIDQVLSSNPSERRAIFEEAAGISRYKAQRREALGKLAGVDTNLARITDVIEEVARQIGSLRRQAAKALRFRRIRHRLTHLELASGAHRHALLRGEIEGLETRATELRTQVESLRAELEVAESGLAHQRGRRLELNERLQTAQQAVFALRLERESAQNKAEGATLRREDVKRRVHEIDREIGLLESRQQALSERLAGETRNKEEQLNLFSGSDEVFREKSLELTQLQNRVTEAENEVSRAKQALLMKESAITRARSNCTTIEVDLKTYQVRHANLTEELYTLQQESEVLLQEAETIRRTFAARVREQEQQKLRVTEAQEQVVALTTEFRDLQRSLQDVDRKLAGSTAQIGVLEGLQEKFEGFSEGARAILQNRLPGTIDGDGYSLLLKNLRVAPEWTKQVELLLGTATDAIHLHDVRRLAPVAERLEVEKLGRAVLSVDAPSLGAPLAATLPGLRPASDVVASDHPQLAALVANLLHGCFFAETLEGFLDVWQANPGFSFHLVATARGELIDRRGIVHVGGKKAGKDHSFLARATEIQRLREERARLQNQSEELHLRAQQQQGRIEAAEKRVEDQRRLQLEIAQEVSTLQAQERQAQKNVEQNHRSAQQKDAEVQNLERTRDDSQARMERAQQELAHGEAELAAQKARIEACEQAAAQARDAREAHKEQFNEIRLEISEKRQRLEILTRGLDEIEKQSREVHETRLRRAQELDTLREQIEQLGRESLSQTERAGEIERTLQVTMQTLEADRTALQGVEREIAAVEQGLQGRRESNDRLGRELGTLEVQLARQQSQLQHLVEEITRDYQLELTNVDWKLQLWNAGEALPERIRVEIGEEGEEDAEDVVEERPAPTAEDLAKLESTDWEAIAAEVQTLRSRLQGMGQVNEDAILEYKSLKERYTFLKTQSDDLWKAKNELMTAIDEINRTSQQLFANTFEQIRKNFKFTFETLFGGGFADLQLVDNGDVLESGIDISAQPPGTKLRSIALLSGGQKTMTAVGLLFAIYMVKPSPFCVLDEIDAPLDDANIGRFCKMLERFLEFSQFIIITHNKRTIGVADTIYGVTMQERGVSRVLSMRYNKATGEAEMTAAPTESKPPAPLLAPPVGSAPAGHAEV